MMHLSSIKTLKPALYLVSTPIGNLADITIRALDVLKRVDFILAEDTRHAGKLMKAYDIATPLRSYHDHNGAKIRPQILQELGEGKAVALISDAGTPLICDPGYKLVQDAIKKNIEIISIPGASAPISALICSGLAQEAFLFIGFIPPKPTARLKFFQKWQKTPASLIVFETGPRLVTSLNVMQTSLGDRQIAICRELTKLHEEIKRGMLSELAQHYANSPTPKGEIIIVIAPPDINPTASIEDIRTFIGEALINNSVNMVAKKTADTFDISKREAYQLALDIRKACE